MDGARNLSYSFLLHSFEEIEKEFCLDNSRIRGVPWWDVVRYPLFHNLLCQAGLQTESGKGPVKPWRSGRRVIKLVVFPVSFLIELFSKRSPLWCRRNKIIIFGHPRRKLEGGKFIDVYSDPLIELLPDPGDCVVIERAEGGRHRWPAATKNLFYLDPLVTLGSIFAMVRPIKLSADELKTLRSVEHRIHEVLGFKVQLVARVIAAVRAWRGIFPVMSYFFRRKRPTHVFIVVSAGYEAVIASAKANNLPTLELQHGSPARGKVNYDYSSGLAKYSFPDWFLSFGRFWSAETQLPLPSDRIIPFGYPYLAKKIKCVSHIKKEDLLVVISQPVISHALIEFTLSANIILPDRVSIIYKPHPSEFYSDSRSYFSELERAGVEVTKQDDDLYEVLARAKWQAGVYSTALYEGVRLGAYCYVIKAPGAEHMQGLVRMGLAMNVEKPADIELSREVDPNRAEQLFAYPSRERLLRLLREAALSSTKPVVSRAS